MPDELELIRRARAGDRRAFDALVAPHLPKLRSFLMRLVANPEDAGDVAQEATLAAFQKLDAFRGESTFQTWLFSIASHLGLTLLRSRKRWPTTTQLEMHDRCHEDAAFLAKLGGEVSAPDFRYEVGEHVAYCFSCIGRALDPEESAAVILSEVFEMRDADAARALSMNESTFRHRLASGRRTMIDAFEGLCALVGKGGACHQCKTLREACPDEARRGRDVPRFDDAADANDDGEARFVRRLAVVREADVNDGTTARLHALMLRFIAQHV